MDSSFETDEPSNQKECAKYSQELSCDDDSFSYTRNINNVKKQLGSNHDNINLIRESLCGALEGTHHCISKAIDLIEKKLKQDEQVDKDSVHSYLDDVLCLLEMINQYLQCIVKTGTPLECSYFNDLPVTMSSVLITVFKHCKNSESLYGADISQFEKKLKNLFKKCHELQLLHFLILEKHYIFDLTEDDELGVLIQVLDIAVSIGEIVLDLDIRTMAEQWKGYSLLCEKYADWLKYKCVTEKACDILCNVVARNVHVILSNAMDHMLVHRSLKVSNFMLKIIIKLCQVLDNQVVTNCNRLILLLVLIISHCNSYLSYKGRTEQQIENFKSHISIGAQPLLNQLMKDAKFAQAVLSFEINTLDRPLKLGYALMLRDVMKSLLERDDFETRSHWYGDDSSQNIVCRFIKIMDTLHVELGLKLQYECYVRKGEPPRSCGLYEHLLIPTAALAATANIIQSSCIQHSIMRALLQTDFYRALFASDLWCILSRFSSTELCKEHVIYLIETSKKVDQLDQGNPQQTYVSLTATRLFRLLSDKEKLEIEQLYPIYEERNIRVLSMLEADNLPEDKKRSTDEFSINKLFVCLKKLQFSDVNLLTSDVCLMIELMNLISTSSMLAETADAILDGVVYAWKKCLPGGGMLVQFQGLTTSSRHWLARFILALCKLTDTLIYVSLFDNLKLVEILEVISKVIPYASNVIKLGFINLLSTLSFYTIPDDQYLSSLSRVIAETFEVILKDENQIVNFEALQAFQTFSQNTNCSHIISKVVAKDSSLKQKVAFFVANGQSIDSVSTLSVEEQLNLTAGLKFEHKCNIFSETCDIIDEDMFEIECIEDMFVENEIVQNIPMKRNKLEEVNEEDSLCIEEILARVQSDMLVLDKYRMKLTSDHRKRIAQVNEKLAKLL